MQRGIGPGSGVGQVLEAGGGRAFRPVRGAQAGDTAAFLVDQDRRRLAQQVADGGIQRHELGRVGDVAGKEDDAQRRRGAEDGCFRRRERRPGDAEDGGAWLHLQPPSGVQGAALARIASHKERAAAIFARPVARSR